MTQRRRKKTTRSKQQSSKGWLYFVLLIIPVAVAYEPVSNALQSGYIDLKPAAIVRWTAMSTP